LLASQAFLLKRQAFLLASQAAGNPAKRFWLKRQAAARKSRYSGKTILLAGQTLLA
jgi:hypothetical protein